MTNLTLPIFTDQEAARKHFEGIRWPSGKPICPHCGTEGEATLVKGKSHRPGMYMCNACRRPFSVTVGTVMEKSHIPINKWLLGFHLMAGSKKGISAHQLHRQLGVTYKSAWFMAHRIRAAMALPDDAGPLGGLGKIVEADETFHGTKDGHHADGGGYGHKMAILSLVERGGPVRSLKIDRADKKTIAKIVKANVHKESRFMTDSASYYRGKDFGFAEHQIVDHSAKEFVRGEAHTNTLEGYFSVFKRGMVGVYQHCGEQHLHRYLAEFDFRQSNRAALGVNDAMRAERAIKGAEGKRLTYHTVSG